MGLFSLSKLEPREQAEFWPPLRSADFEHRSAFPPRRFRVHSFQPSFSKNRSVKALSGCKALSSRDSFESRLDLS